MACVTGEEAPANKSRKSRAGGMRGGGEHATGVFGGALQRGEVEMAVKGDGATSVVTETGGVGVSGAAEDSQCGVAACCRAVCDCPQGLPDGRKTGHT